MMLSELSMKFEFQLFAIYEFHKLFGESGAITAQYYY